MKEFTEWDVRNIMKGSNAALEQLEADKRELIEGLVKSHRFVVSLLTCGEDFLHADLVNRVKSNEALIAKHEVK